MLQFHLHAGFERHVQPLVEQYRGTQVAVADAAGIQDLRLYRGFVSTRLFLIAPTKVLARTDQPASVHAAALTPAAVLRFSQQGRCQVP